MSLEGLWTVEFEVPGGESPNGAVVVLKGSRIYGGDNAYYYLGSYTVSGEQVSGELQITHYRGRAVTAFGDSATAFAVQISGRQNANGDQIVGRIIRPQLGQVNVRMTKRVTLG